MAKWKNSPDLDRYLQKLERLEMDPRTYIGKAIYVAADIVADAISSQISSLPVAQIYAENGVKLSTITSVQKAGLVDGFGIAKMRKDGDYYNVKLGFEGYNGQKTKKYPHGVPNSVIARSIVSGTSFRQKNDFVGKAVRSSKAQAEREMEQELDKQIKELMS